MLLLATDLDGTFLAGEVVCKQQLYRLIKERDDVLLVFVTGRGLESVISLFNDPVIPNPHYIICDVGATIVNGLTLDPIQPLQADIEEKWPGHPVVFNKLKDINGLHLQEVPQMRRCSFFYNKHTDLDEVTGISSSLGCDVVISADKFVDILPPGVNKGSTLLKLVNLLDMPAEQILVAGDTLNDLSLYKIGYKGVVVGEAEEKLLAATKDIQYVYQAVQTGCGGILESLEHFDEFRHYLPGKEIQKK